eukprot:418519-Prymnesium_polylepis.1
MGKGGMQDASSVWTHEPHGRLRWRSRDVEQWLWRSGRARTTAHALPRRVPRRVPPAHQRREGPYRARAQSRTSRREPRRERA